MPEAVVIGAGPVGLASAMLLADRGFEVTVVDRDGDAPETAEAAWSAWERRSVTQFRQVHFLQPGGRAILDEHLPKVVEHLLTLGAVRFNPSADYARQLPGGPLGDEFDRFETVTTCRRPVLELAFALAAADTTGIEIRRRVVVDGFETGTEAIDGIPHVVGVRTDGGEVVTADLVIDAAGRRSPVPGLLAGLGGPPVTEQVEDLGFVYNTQFYRGDRPPELRGDILAAVGSISVLTMPGDNGYWSVTLYHSPNDRPMRKIRDGRVFERVVRSLPLHAHWADGETVGEVVSMAASTNTRRQFVHDGLPAATGLVPVGDAWGFTNPSIGRGITLGIMHATDVVPTVADHLEDPAALARGWSEATAVRAEPWHEATVDFDRIRGPEVEAYRQGLPDPHDPNDLSVAGPRAFETARHHDREVLHWWSETANCFTLPLEVARRPGVFERVLEVAMAHEPFQTPGPDRAQLEALLT